MNIKKYNVHYNKSKFIEEYDIPILLVHSNDKYNCTHIPAINDPLSYKYGDLIYINDMILYNNVYYQIKDTEWIYNWNLFIQRETGNTRCYNPGDMAILGYNNKFIRGVVNKYTEFYKYRWIKETKKFINGRLDQFPIYKKPIDINLYDYFLVAPLRTSSTVQLFKEGIVAGSDIYGPIDINIEYKSIFEFWKVYRSTIYRINNYYNDIIVIAYTS